jgi:uncharacterized membrane protein
MLELITSLFASSGFGAIIGGIGAWITRREERKNLEAKYEYDLKMANIRIEELKLEQAHELAVADKNIQRAEVEGTIQRDLADTMAFKDSLSVNLKSYGSPIIDGIIGLMRPIITIYLLVVASFIVWQINTLAGGLQGLQTKELLPIYKETIAQIIFLSTTAVTWWFGSRPSSMRK